MEIEAEMAKLQSLSVALYTDELLEAGVKTFCYRQAEFEKPVLMNKSKEKTCLSFAECVELVPYYVTLPKLVSVVMDSQAASHFNMELCHAAFLLPETSQKGTSRSSNIMMAHGKFQP